MLLTEYILNSQPEPPGGQMQNCSADAQNQHEPNCTLAAVHICSCTACADGAATLACSRYGKSKPQTTNAGQAWLYRTLLELYLSPNLTDEPAAGSSEAAAAASSGEARNAEGSGAPGSRQDGEAGSGSGAAAAGSGGGAQHAMRG